MMKLRANIFNDLFIFEMANNHQGNLEHGINIIREIGKVARKHNIKAGVKLQYRALDTFIHPDYQKRDDVKHIPRFMSTRLSNAEFNKLVSVIKEENMVSICTPFDEESVGVCLDHGIQIIKVASCSVKDWPLLTEIAKANKPVIVSTGGAAISDIDKVFNFFTHRHISFAILHCVGLYPTPNDRVQLDFIERLKNRYPGIEIGYSGHEAPGNYDVVKVAVAKGAQILERHVGLPTETITLNNYSMNPEETSKWVENALIAKDICKVKGDTKYVSQDEIDSLRSLMRGAYAAKKIKKGQKICREDIFFAMPILENQVSSGEYYEEMVASKNYNPKEPIYENNKEDTISAVRSIIHDAKGMLYESKITLGDQFEIELSHHYGMDHFRQFGALIVNIINREYCKKIIVILPGQKHPNHHHKIKEETFQLLHGDMKLTLDGQEINMKPGDIVVVERGKWHSFTTANGAIFEEISTTHVKKDSYYEDSKIARLDPILRKTVLDSW